MTRTFVELAVAALLFGASAALRPPARDDDALGALRSLLAPIALPHLWSELQRAQLDGDPIAIVATGRALTRLLPEWVDGHAHFAWQLAIAVPAPGDDAGRRVDRLVEAWRWLEDHAERLAGRTPSRAAELLMTAATLIEHRCASDPGIDASFRARFARDATEVAFDLVTRAGALAPNASARSARAHLSFRMIAGALRMADLERAELMRERAVRDLADEPDAGEQRAALQRLRSFAGYLTPDGDAAIAAIANDPFLTEIADALRALRRG